MSRPGYYEENKEKIKAKRKQQYQQNRVRLLEEAKTKKESFKEEQEIIKRFEEFDRINGETYSDRTIAIVAARDKANKYAPVQPIKIIEDDFFDDLEEPTDEELRRIEGDL